MEFIVDQMSPENITSLGKLIKSNARPGMVVIELGSYTGKSSLTMLPHIKETNGKLFCVDWFKGSPRVVSTISKSYKDRNILNVFRENIKEAGYEDNVIVLVATANDAVQAVADEVADIFFIDADHRYSYIRNDILNWYPKLKKGGLVCGHDFENHLNNCNYLRVLEKCEEDHDINGGIHYGVIRAACELFSDVHWEGGIWSATKDDIHPVLDFALSFKKEKDSQDTNTETTLNRLINYQTNDPRIINALASLLSDEGMKAEAIRILERGLIEHPLNSQLISHYSILLYEAGKYEDSIEQLKELSKMMPEDPITYNKLGELFYGSGRIDEAEQAFNMAFDLFPDLTDVLNNLSVLYWEKGDYEKGLLYADKVMGITCGSDLDPVLNYSHIMDSLGKTEDAVEILKSYFYKTNDDRVLQDLEQLTQKLEGN